MTGERAAEAGSPASPLTLRPALVSDCPAITEIYRHHVLTGLGSFEEEPPDLAEMRRRHAEIMARQLPYLVAERDSCLAGYAYAAPYRARSAYRHTLEDSIYVAPWAQGSGAGDRLLAELILLCTEAGYRQIVAVIGDSANAASISLHAACGFLRVGTLRSVGFKFGRWVDSVFMQRPLGKGDGSKP